MVGGDLPSCEATLSGQLSLPDITSRCAWRGLGAVKVDSCKTLIPKHDSWEQTSYGC